MRNQVLQRVYAVTFPSKPQMLEWKRLKEEAEKRDHRNIGRAQKLFMFHNYSPGSAFFLPHGTRIYNKLEQLIRCVDCVRARAFALRFRNEYKERNYDEVKTPIIYNKELWETSGHWQNYKENMFCLSNEHKHDHDKEHTKEVEMALKPMNCPGHCLIFEAGFHSYRDLPVRLADFSPLHRNEPVGSLSGLTRVRRFSQDDAHIFCSEAQLEEEVMGTLEFVKKIYSIFGMEFSLFLSTRPPKFIGTVEEVDNRLACVHARARIRCAVARARVLMNSVGQSRECVETFARSLR